jgi:hypothetical protein
MIFADPFVARSRCGYFVFGKMIQASKTGKA